MPKLTRRAAVASGIATLAAPAIVRAGPLEIPFFYPIAVSGTLSKLIDGYAADFGAEHKDIAIKPVYAGSYDDTIAKAVPAFKAGSAPPLAMLGAIQVYALTDMEALVPFDDLVSTPEDKAWLKSFFPAFLANGNVLGKTWSIPFQRSTVVLFWNKDAFKEAGLDPERPPANWAEHTAFATKLTKKSGDMVARYGDFISYRPPLRPSTSPYTPSRRMSGSMWSASGAPRTERLPPRRSWCSTTRRQWGSTTCAR